MSLESLRFKVNIHNPIVFLYTSNEQVKIDIKRTMPFTMNMDYFEIHLTKYVQLAKNYKTLMRQTKDINKWRDRLCT